MIASLKYKKYHKLEGDRKGFKKMWSPKLRSQNYEQNIKTTQLDVRDVLNYV